jgi:hypothetical protein
MIGAWVKNFGLGLAFAMIFVVTAQSGGTLSYNNILGKWCGVSTNPNLTNMLFARDTLTITHLPQNTTTVFAVDHYEFTDTMVKLHYRASGTALTPVPSKEIFRADYSDFSSDGKTMSQPAIPNINRGAYHFMRCS